MSAEMFGLLTWVAIAIATSTSAIGAVVLLISIVVRRTLMKMERENDAVETLRAVAVTAALPDKVMYTDDCRLHPSVPPRFAIEAGLKFVIVIHGGPGDGKYATVDFIQPHDRQMLVRSWIRLLPEAESTEIMMEQQAREKGFVDTGWTVAVEDPRLPPAGPYSMADKDHD